MENIYLAGGCFWGIEAYFNNITGVEVESVGYANGNKESPSYEEVCSQKYNFAETIKLKVDTSQISFEDIFSYFFKVINPTSLNKQGNDIGLQYRTGIYYTCDEQKKIAENYIKNKQKDFPKPICVEVLPIDNYYCAEDYHQQYLFKNPNGYCHIPLSLINNPQK